MKKNVQILLLSVLFCLISSFSFAGLRQLNIPEVPPSDDVRNMTIIKIDLPSGFEIHGSENYSKLLGWAGWPTGRPIHSWVDIHPGLLQTWKKNNVFVFIKYGFFDTNQEAKEAAKHVLVHQSPEMINIQKEGSFSGQLFGESSYRWSLSMEKDMGGLNPSQPRGDDAILSFSEGKCAVMIRVASNEVPFGSLDKRDYLENTARICEKKIEIATSLSNFTSNLSSLIIQKGILNSLQTKLDHFTKNYHQGDYKVALNNINSFINELNAQRGKNISEAAYQTLKGYADAVVQSLNSLMEASPH